MLEDWKGVNILQHKKTNRMTLAVNSTLHSRGPFLPSMLLRVGGQPQRIQEEKYNEH